jgi:hypothetical protein
VGYDCNGFHRISTENGSSFDAFGTGTIFQEQCETKRPYFHMHIVYHHCWCRNGIVWMLSGSSRRWFRRNFSQRIKSPTASCRIRTNSNAVAINPKSRKKQHLINTLESRHGETYRCFLARHGNTLTSLIDLLL